MKYTKEYIQILNESANINENATAQSRITAKELLSLIESLPDSESHIHFDDKTKLWNVTQEWLVGGFAGRSFEGKTKEEAAEEQIEYLNRHIGHDSIVGNIVTKSGWPNPEKVKTYIASKVETDDQELNEAFDGSITLLARAFKRGVVKDGKTISPLNYEIRIKDGSYVGIAKIEDDIIYLKNGKKFSIKFDSGIMLRVRPAKTVVSERRNDKRTRQR